MVKKLNGLVITTIVIQSPRKGHFTRSNSGNMYTAEKNRHTYSSAKNIGAHRVEGRGNERAERKKTTKVAKGKPTHICCDDICREKLMIQQSVRT